MNIKITMKIVIMSLLLFVIFAVAALIAGLNESSQNVDATTASAWLLLTTVLFSIVVSYPIIRSKWQGFKLVLSIFIVIFGIQTFLTQIETIVFLDHLVDVISPDMIPKLFVQGFIISFLFAPLAVFIHGKIKGNSNFNQEKNMRLVMPFKQWLWKLLLIGVVYFIIYAAFGALVFVPLAGDAFQEYYQGLETPNWMPLFQILRGMIWAMLALPIIKMMKGSWWEAGLAVALLYSVLMGANLLIPTTIMPDEIRLSHLVEVFSSNFIFGWIVVWIFHKKHTSFFELFKRSSNQNKASI